MVHFYRVAFIYRYIHIYILYIRYVRLRCWQCFAFFEQLRYGLPNQLPLANEATKKLHDRHSWWGGHLDRLTQQLNKFIWMNFPENG